MRTFFYQASFSLQEVRNAAEESRGLRSRLQQAEEAQKQARSMEMDYEEVIHLLEAEIAELKTQRVEPSAPTKKVEPSAPPKKVEPSAPPKKVNTSPPVRDWDASIYSD